MVVCGGLGGVMEAAARGAAGAGGEVIGIVPGADPAEANPYCTHVVATGIGHARNLAVVASGRRGDRDRRRVGDALGDRVRAPARAAGGGAAELEGARDGPMEGAPGIEAAPTRRRPWRRRARSVD